VEGVRHSEKHFDRVKNLRANGGIMVKMRTDFAFRTCFPRVPLRRLSG
jgi:hypothetical protein